MKWITEEGKLSDNERNEEWSEKDRVECWEFSPEFTDLHKLLPGVEMNFIAGKIMLFCS